MSEYEKFRPNEENLGKECVFWSRNIGCMYPKMQMEGRRSCEGIVDDVCLYLKDGRLPKSLTEQQIFSLKTRPPTADKSYIPPGDTH